MTIIRRSACNLCKVDNVALTSRSVCFACVMMSVLCVSLSLFAFLLHNVRYQIRTIPNLLIRVFVKKNLSVEEARASILDGVSRLICSTDLV